MKYSSPTFEEAGHVAVTVLESLLEKVFAAGEKIVEETQKAFSPGIIGPFALQSAIVEKNGKKEIVVFDVSFRMPGSPGISATPYASYLFGETVSMGKRIAMEIKDATEKERLEEIVT
jgi:5-formaminoimidazole-4-carboxamide-1-(beta)-D-ribofuranosyl 5'-monophosphate synthetase